MRDWMPERWKNAERRIFDGLSPFRPTQPSEREHAGPDSAICDECGLEIGAYASRRYGDSGAVHVWKPGVVAELGDCLTQENKHNYPYFYTDG
jgi:hypothetical protein